MDRFAAAWPGWSASAPDGIVRCGRFDGSGRVAECGTFYRPRHLERTAFDRLIESHFDGFAAAHEPPSPEASVPGGLPAEACAARVGGRAASRGCGVRRAGEQFGAFSCATRNFCASCQQTRAELLAEKLREEILADVPHRHAVFTVPRALRKLFLRDRSLLGLLARCAAETVQRVWRAALGRREGAAGIVASIQTFGSQANWHPHVDALIRGGTQTESR